MANDLTGDFDVVVEFSLPAANRVLAAMHANERFLHSVALRVDDNQPPSPTFPRPSIGGSVDAFGEPIANHKQIGQIGFLPSQLTAANPVVAALNPVVNSNVAVIFDPPIVPSHLQGRAQLQLSPPIIDVPDATGTHIRARIEIMARYLPDPKTAPAAEFVRGELQITAPVNLFSSNASRVVEIDIRSSNVATNFDVVWSNTPLNAQDLTGINLLIRNALKTGFLPTNASLPSRVTDLQVKPLTGFLNAFAILLNMTPLLGTGGSSAAGHAATVHDIFITNHDDFAFAVGKDYVQAAFPSVTDHRFPTISGYTFTVTGPTLQFQTGQMLLLATGHAHNPSEWYPDFDFTVGQALTLNLAATTPGGPLDTAVVVAVGDISLGINGVPDFIVNLFDGSLKDTLRQKRDSTLQNINLSVKTAFDIDTNLGQFLTSLLNPATQTNIGTQSKVSIRLAYTSVEIQPSGIILHGSLAVPAWAAAHVEYEQVPVNNATNLPGGSVILGGPDYSAFKTWIPGGFIGRYEWAYHGQTPPVVDDNKFVLVRTPVNVSTNAAAAVAPSASAPASFAPPGVAATGAIFGFSPFCLTVVGSRIPSSGSGNMQPVTATTCVMGSFPVITGVLTENSPVIALTQPDPQGNVVVIGHAPAASGGSATNAPNLIVHFADDTTAGNLEFLTQALSQSKRRDAATAVLAVLTQAQLSKARHLRDVIYSDDHSAWEHLYKISSAKKPLTLIVSPKGKIVWQHSGTLTAAALAVELKKALAPGLALNAGVLRLALRIGTAPPNFLFEYAPGREMTLSKLDSPAVIVFWRSTSKPSIDAVHDVQKTGEKSQGTGTVVLAVNDGESIEIAKKAAASHKFSATVVTDPDRAISRAYGVNLWPTIVFLDAQGIVRQVRYGRISPETSASPTAGNPKQPGK